MRMIGLRIVVVAWLVACAGLAAGQNVKPDPATQPADVVVLQMGRRDNQGLGTIWRYREVVGTDVARTDAGQLVPVDPFQPRQGYDRGKVMSAKGEEKEAKYPLQPAPAAQLTPAPPAEWMRADFDDGDWARVPMPCGASYRGIALACLRARFLVNDPAKVTELSLDASVQGGAVFYLNGQEIGRVGLPEGKLDNATLAQDYPKETYFVAGGSPMPHGVYGSAGPVTVNPYSGTMTLGENDLNSGRNPLHKDPQVQAAYKQRFRHVTIKPAPGALKAGVNCLAVEVHRSPAPEAMFTTVLPKVMGAGLIEQRCWWWNRCSLEDFKLTARAVPGAVEANVARPARDQLWNCPLSERPDVRYYGEPGAACGPIRIQAVRNGAFSGQIVLTSPKPIRGLKVAWRPLSAAMSSDPESMSANSGRHATAPGKPLPAAWARIGYPSIYPGIGYDPVEESPLENPPPPKGQPAPPPVQPIVLTVNVPKDAEPGTYAATLAVSAEGLSLESKQVPVEVTVGGWTLPDPQSYTMYNAFIQSPDSLALTYDVPMWSKAHWALIERSFAVLGHLACKEINIPLVRRAHFGNEHGMVWWVRQPDGSIRPRLDIAEKYIDLAVKHLGKIPVICFYVIEADVDQHPWVTYFDPRTGELQEGLAPAWGTEEARAFWRPAMEGLRAILAQRGLEGSYCLGYHAAGGNGPVASKGCLDDMKELAPDARWVRLGHYWFRGHDNLDKGPNGNPWGRVSLVSGAYIVGWDPVLDKPFYGWRNPHTVLAYTRGIFGGGNPVSDYRLAPETVVLSGWREETGASAGRYDIASGFGRDIFPGLRGFGPWGADFWARIIARYNDPAAAQWDPRCSWSTTQLDAGIIPFVIGKGATGPVESLRTLAFREGIEELEARRLVQDAVDDAAAKAKLGDALHAAAKELCDDRSRLLRYWCQCGGFDPARLAAANHDLYDMAGQIAKALAK